MTKTKWCVIQKTKTETKSEFAVKINTDAIKISANSPPTKEVCDQTFSLIFFMSRPCALVLSSPSARLLAEFLRLKSSFLAVISRSVRRRVSADWLTVLGLVVVDSLARRSASRDLL